MKAREILNIDSFDPLEVDISFLKDVTARIPKEGYMDVGMAEQLATITLRAAEQCDDLLGQAVLLLSHRESEQRTAKALVTSTLLSSKTPSTVVKELVASDPSVIETMNNYNKALAWHSWLQNKYSTLIKTHHWCKDQVRRTETGTLGASHWESNHNKDEEDNWKV